MLYTTIYIIHYTIAYGVINRMSDMSGNMLQRTNINSALIIAVRITFLNARQSKSPAKQLLILGITILLSMVNNK